MICIVTDREIADMLASRAACVAKSLFYFADFEDRMAVEEIEALSSYMEADLEMIAFLSRRHLTVTYSMAEAHIPPMAAAIASVACIVLERAMCGDTNLADYQLGLGVQA